MTLPNVKDKSDQEAAKIMADWFLSNFEDPVENTPRDDGEWVYIWGEPTTPENELLQFNVRDEVREMALNIIKNEVGDMDPGEWVPIPREEDDYE